MLALLFSYSRYACFVPVATACLAGGEPYNRSASQGARGTGVHHPAGGWTDASVAEGRYRAIRRTREATRWPPSAGLRYWLCCFD